MFTIGRVEGLERRAVAATAVLALVLGACDRPAEAGGDAGLARSQPAADGGGPRGGDGDSLRRAGELTRRAVDPTESDEASEGRCSVARSPGVAQGWNLVGYRPGPVLEDVLAAGARRETLVAVTRRELCVSDDEGATWRTRLGGDQRLDEPTLGELGADDALVLIAQGSAERPSAPRVYVSRDAGGRWSERALPPEAAAAGAGARAFHDRLRRIFVATPTQLWTSTDGGEWEGPRALPGATAREVDACGDTLIARAQMDRDSFYFRSEDRGSTWRPFRLGALGLEAEGAVVRCVRWRGGIEAGRAPVPGWWSFDQGRSWQPSRYDSVAVRDGRARDADPGLAAVTDAPRCMTAPTGELACVAPRRLLLPDHDAPWRRDRPTQREISAPARCDRLRRVDDRRVVAFGPACGLYVSRDLGGVWRAMSTHLDASRADAVPGRGTGGFVDRDTAWRLDGGLWWTQDGGARWRLVPSARGRSLLWGTFVDRRRGVFVQRDGWVVATDDGGVRWRLVLRGEVSRLVTSGRTVMLTTSDRAMLSLDGGGTWRRVVTLPSDRELDPALEVDGERRRLDPSPRLRVVQQHDAIELVRREGGAAGREVLVRGLPRAWVMLAAHSTGGAVDRVLLAGGAVLHRRTELAAR